MKKLKLMALIAMMAMLGSCSKGGDDNGDDDPFIPGGGSGNSGLQSSAGDIGMTYAIVNGSVDLSRLGEISSYTYKEAGFEAGIEYGEDVSSMQKVRGTTKEGSFSVTLYGLKPNKQYYIRTYINPFVNVDGTYVPLEGKGYSQYGNTGTFTTKEASFNGSMTATKSGATGMNSANIKLSYSTGGMNSKETYTKAFVYSPNQSDLDESGLAGRYSKAMESSLKQPNYVTPYHQAYGEDAKFILVTDENEVILELNPGKTYYYRPFIMIGDVAFAGPTSDVTSDGVAGDEDFIDLGLSCLWSVKNLGASSPYLPGSQHQLDRTLEHNYFKSGERIPTKNEIQELNDKCKTEERENGLLITGPNGNKIFIACSTVEKQAALGFGYPYFGTSSGKDASGNTKYDTMFKYDHRTKKFTTENYTTYTSVYIRTVKDKSGGGGGNNNFNSTTDLRSLLTKPLGFVDVNLKTASYEQVVNSLSEYVLREDCYGDSYDEPVLTFLLMTNDNPSCSNITYCGLSFDSFYGCDFSKYYLNYSHTFKIEKSKALDPYVYLDRIVQDFHDIGIPITYSKGESGDISGFYNNQSEQITYGISLVDYSDEWQFSISISRWLN